MKIKEVLEKAKKELAFATGFKSPAAIGAKKEGDKWVVTVEIIEKTSIPEGMDILGTYEVKLDESGELLGYQRKSLRKRMDTGVSAEE